MELLKDLYHINAKSGHEDQLIAFIWPILEKTGARVRQDSMGNVYAVKGSSDSYPCVAAHLDEVHLPSERNIKEENGLIYAVDEEGCQVGIGADDKNGIWIILRLLEQVDIMKAVLFVEEERNGDLAGGRGSRACDLAFFDDCRYVVQCDRRGRGDVVTFSEKAGIRLCEDDFIPTELLKKHGYAVVNGGTSDVTQLRRRGLQIPCCNISCGYYNEHTNNEYTLWNELLDCLAFVKGLLHNS